MTAQRCRSAQLVYYDRRPGSALCFMFYVVVVVCGAWCTVVFLVFI
jgi:hypothetical protein